MENFILYEEIGHGKNSVVYKGRRKGTINFLAILCIEKCKRASITNWVRLTHEIDHIHIVKFYEWYETSNHLWMVVELCTGGTLQNVIHLDHCLPEEMVRTFGCDVALGLYHLHQLGVIFGNLCPQKILLDGPGILKLTNFGMARLEGEDLAEVYEQATAQHRDSGKAYVQNNLMGDPEYAAPEVLKDKEPTIASDLWSFGILLYYLHAGRTPFKGQNHADIVRQVCHCTYDSTDVVRKRNFSLEHLSATIRNEKPSADFVNLLSGLLKKKPEERLSWSDIIIHPFWKNNLNHLHPDPVISPGNSEQNATKDSIEATGSYNERDIELQTLTNSGKEDGNLRRSTVPKRVDVTDDTFSLSSRPHTALLCCPEKQTKSISPVKSAPALEKTFTIQGRQLLPSLSQNTDEKSSFHGGSQSEKPVKSAKKKFEVRQNSQSSDVMALEDVKDLIYHPSDMEFSIIQDNPQISHPDPLIWDSKHLPFRPLRSLDGATPDDLYNHLQVIIHYLNDSSNPHKTKAAVVTYLAQLCSRSGAVANFTVNSQLLRVLADLAKQWITSQSELGVKSARAIGLASCYATELDYGTKITDIFTILSDAMRENFRNQRVKLAMLPALGQLLYLVAEQEEGNLCNTAEEDKKGNWGVPSSAYLILNRCLREGEDPVIQHIACKTIENVMTKTGSHRKRFILSSQSQGQGAEVIGTLLWTIANRAPSEALRESAMSALCRMNNICGNGSMFQGVLDKVGLPGVLSTLSKSNAHCVQSIITLFVENLHSASKGQANRLAASKELLPSLMKFLDIPSTVVRAKVFLAILLLVRRNPENLLLCCNKRLVMYIERDSKKTAASMPASGSMDDANPYAIAPAQLQNFPPGYEYMQSALNLLVRHILMQCQPIMAACVSILEETNGRKHPSTNHIKRLKICLPTCMVVVHTVTSQVFRNLITSDFITELGSLLSFAIKFIQQDSSVTGIITALGEEVVQQFVDMVLSIVESLSQQPNIITQHEKATMHCLVPQLIVLLGIYNGDGIAVCVKLLDDLFRTVLHHRAVAQEDASQTTKTAWDNDGKRLPDEKRLCDLITNSLLPEYQPILLGRDPLPAYGIRLLSTLLENWQSLVNSVKECGLLPVILQVFSEQLHCALGSCAQGIVSVLALFVSTGNLQIINELYDAGLINVVNSHLVEVSCQYMEAQEIEDENNSAIATDSLVNLLILLKDMLSLVTGEVKKALQVKEDVTVNKESVTENAERLLVINKPLTDLQGICINLLCDDRELADLALTNFSMLVQLYGGDHPDTLADENMECLATALVHSQPKQQKILLKIIKRVVSLNEYHAEHLYAGELKSGSTLLEALQKIMEEAEQRADLVIAQLAEDIISDGRGRRAIND